MLHAAACRSMSMRDDVLCYIHQRVSRTVELWIVICERVEFVCANQIGSAFSSRRLIWTNEALR
jgi:hypothetical protein